MTLVETSLCRIQYINDKGLGISSTIHGRVELPYTLESELVEFERHKYRGQTSFILKKIVNTAPNRVAPLCKYFGACGGCSLQHLNSVSYNQYKLNNIKNLLHSRNIEVIVDPVVIIPFGNRRRISIEILKKKDQVFLGLHRFHSHQIININECPAILDSLSSLLDPLRAVLNQILQNSQKAQMFLSSATNGIHILLKIHNQETLLTSQSCVLEKFCKDYNIIQLVYASSTSKEVIYRAKVPYIKINDIEVAIDADSFIQASHISDQVLKEIALDFLVDPYDPYSSKRRLVDLFCGRGTFTIPFGEHFTVDGFEIEDNAIHALNEALINSSLDITLKQCNLYDDPLHHTLLNRYDFALINPPRAGAEQQCSELAKSNIAKIAYISCNPASFLHDTQILYSGGYKLIKIVPIDQFPFTSHIEIAGLFMRF